MDSIGFLEFNSIAKGIEAADAVVKAADAGRQPFEKLCAALHGEFAVRLRRHEPLPGALLPYLCHAYQMMNQ